MKTTNESVKFETLNYFFYFFFPARACARILIKTHKVKVDVLLDRKIYCLQVRPSSLSARKFYRLGQ